MMFKELLDNPSRIEPGPLQKTARQQFPAVVGKSHLKQHTSGSDVPTSGKYTIIGIATYSPLELQLLDDLDATYPQWGSTGMVAVFDLMECSDLGDARKHLPIFATVKQTPVVAIWDDGRLIASQTGLRMTREALQGAGFLK
jgi:hypothetical protein